MFKILLAQPTYLFKNHDRERVEHLGPVVRKPFSLNGG